MGRGIRFLPWYRLLPEFLSILCGQGSLVGMERSARRHHQSLNQLLGNDASKSPSDSTFRLQLAQPDVAGFVSLLRDSMTPQPGFSDLNTLVCDASEAEGLDRRNRFRRVEVHRSGVPHFPIAGPGDRPDHPGH